MEVREVRIGNWVNCPNDKQNPFRIDEIEVYRSGLCIVGMGMDLNTHPETWYGSDIEPIPITEEWLVKFGFEKSKHWYTLEDIAISTDMNRLTQKVYGMYVEIYNQFKCPEYVHQLQNLYFALTGEELTIKSNPNDKS